MTQTATEALAPEVFDEAYRARCSARAPDAAAPFDVALERDRLRRLAEGGDVPADGLVQGARPEQQAAAAVARRAAGGRHLLLGRQPRAGCGVRGCAARDPGHRPHGEQCNAGEDRGHEELRRRGHPPRHDLGRSERRGDAAPGRARPDVHPPVRRPAADRRAGDGRTRDPRGRTRCRHGHRPDRRRRADLGHRGRDQGAAAERAGSSASSRRAHPR